VLKSLRDINIKAGKITVEATFVLRFPTKDVPDEVLDHIIKTGINARINEASHSFVKEDSSCHFKIPKYTDGFILKEEGKFISIIQRTTLDISFNIISRGIPFDYF